MEPLIFMPLRPARIAVDFNARSADDLVRAGFEDVTGPLPTEGALVEVVEPEDGLVGIGYVQRLNHEARLVYLEVVWSSLHDVTSRDGVVSAHISSWSTGESLGQRRASAAVTR